MSLGSDGMIMVSTLQLVMVPAGRMWICSARAYPIHPADTMPTAHLGQEYYYYWDSPDPDV